jgi:hypothetical protein
VDDAELRALLEAVARGERSADEAARELRQRAGSGRADLDRFDSDYADLGFAKLDLARASRTGVAEAVFAESKSDDELLAIVDALVERTGSVLVTRLAPERVALLAARHARGRYRSRARVWTCGEPSPPLAVRVGVVSAGTSDLAVAEEAAEAAAWLGLEVERCADVGVAGLGRLLARVGWLRELDIVIAVAGMDGALPTVIAGLVSSPVIAVPTSVGYGASYGGVAALLTMLNACAPGIAVVNIDNGFGAAVMARRIAAVTVR